MPPSSDRVRPHLRVLTPHDGAWMIELDHATAQLAHRQEWELETLESALDDGEWAGVDQWGWAIVLDGVPVGWVLVRGLDGDQAELELRVEEEQRGRGIGREVLRQVADHHFAASPDLQRISGRAHERNVAMQRAFNAAGFRMEARYRETHRDPDGTLASEWGYALTRRDWSEGRHRAGAHDYDLHGTTFVVEQVRTDDPHLQDGVAYKFLQEGRRVIARYEDGRRTIEGEFAGTLVGDQLRYRFVHEHDDDAGTYVTITGGGHGRLQRRSDGRLEIVNDWLGDDGRHGTTVLVQQRPADSA